MRTLLLLAMLLAAAVLCRADAAKPVDTVKPAEPANAATLTITTRDGQTYKDAVVEGVTPTGIDIGYVNDTDHFVMRGLDFKDLPDDLQKKYGYDPAAAQAFDAKVQSAGSADLTSTANAEKERLAQITQEIHEKFAGQNVQIKPADLQYAVFANRLSVQLASVAATQTGCVAKITQLISGTPVGDLVMIDGQTLPQGGEWSGFIYPTGLNTKYNNQTIPVYTGTPERAVGLLNYNLNIYSEYAAARQSDTTTTDDGSSAPPDQTADAYDTTTDDAGDADDDTTDDADDGTVVNNYYPDDYDDGYYGGGGYYFIGGDYWPVHWWWNHHPYPPRPYPPHPPRPPHDGGRHPGGRYPRHPGVRPARRSSFNLPSHTIISHGGFRQAMPRGGGHIGGGGHMGGGGHIGGFR